MKGGADFEVKENVESKTMGIIMQKTKSSNNMRILPLLTAFEQAHPERLE